MTSAARPVTRKGLPVQEMSIQLGGGKTTGKIFFATRDSFGLKTKGHGFEAELATKKQVLGRVQGVAFQKNGRMFSIGLDNYEHPFDCKREVPKGCGEWTDNGVAYVALSTATVRVDTPARYSVIFLAQGRSPLGK